MLYAKCAPIESKVHFLQITSLLTFCTTRSKDALYFSAPQLGNGSSYQRSAGGVIKVTMFWHRLESSSVPLNCCSWNAEPLVTPLRNDMGVMSYSHNSYNFIKCTANKASIMIFSGHITADACCVTARRCSSYNRYME